MSGASFGSLFGDVDLSTEPAALSLYLERVQAVPAVRAAKQESFRLAGVRTGSHVLDVGCGSGHDALAMADIVGPAGSVLGIDKSEILVAQATNAAPPQMGWLHFKCADATALPLPNASFDICRADRTVQHLAGADVALRELARVTRPGGVVIVSEMFNVLELAVDERRDIAERVLAGLWLEQRGWVGLLLPPLFAGAGLENVEVHRHRERLTSFEDVALLLVLSRLCRSAVEEGRTTAAEAERWLANVERDFTLGRAALLSEFLHIKGRTPAIGASETVANPPTR